MTDQQRAAVIAVVRFMVDARERYGRVKDDSEVTPADQRRLTALIREEQQRVSR